MRPSLLNPARRTGVRVILTLSLLAVAMLSCRSFQDRAGSSGAAEGPELDVSGTWTGTWAVTQGIADSGNVTFDIEQDDEGNVFGFSEWTGSPCWSFREPDFVAVPPDPNDPDDANFRAVLDGDTMQSAVVMEFPRDPQGTSPRRAAYRLSGDLEVSGDTMSGTFALVAEGTNTNTTRCDDELSRRGDRGVLQLER